jgi:hypothetical protein
MDEGRALELGRVRLMSMPEAQYRSLRYGDNPEGRRGIPGTLSGTVVTKALSLE